MSHLLALLFAAAVVAVDARSINHVATDSVEALDANSFDALNTESSEALEVDSDMDKPKGLRARRQNNNRARNRPGATKMNMAGPGSQRAFASGHPVIDSTDSTMSTKARMTMIPAPPISSDQKASLLGGGIHQLKKYASENPAKTTLIVILVVFVMIFGCLPASGDLSLGAEKRMMAAMNKEETSKATSTTY